MNVTLRGSSPSTMAAGILLLSRARSFGQRLRVEIVGDPDDIGVVEGPAILHAAPLASCGVGRELGHGALVVVPGPVDRPLAVSLSADGRSDWFEVDRTGTGVHPATRAFLRMRRERRPEVRQHIRQFMMGAEWLGCAPEPAVLDLLFGAPAPPLTRLALALRAGRSISGQRGAALTGSLVGEVEEGPPSLQALLRRLAPGIRETAEAWVESGERIAAAAGDRAWMDALAEIGGQVAELPPMGILPPLTPAVDAVAFGIGRALGATQGNPQAQSQLLETYRFLGGRFTDRAEHTVDLPADMPPDDRLGRWAWFCNHVAVAAERVDRIWRDVVDPPQ